MNIHDEIQDEEVKSKWSCSNFIIVKPEEVESRVDQQKLKQLKNKFLLFVQPDELYSADDMLRVLKGGYNQALTDIQTRINTYFMKNEWPEIVDHISERIEGLRII